MNNSRRKGFSRFSFIFILSRTLNKFVLWARLWQCHFCLFRCFYLLVQLCARGKRARWFKHRIFSFYVWLKTHTKDISVTKRYTKIHLKKLHVYKGAHYYMSTNDISRKLSNVSNGFRMNEWINEWMNEWMNEGRKEGMNEWMKTFFKTRLKYQYDNNGKIYITCLIFYWLVFIFALWESDAENRLLMLLLKMFIEILQSEVPLEDRYIERLRCSWSYSSDRQFLVSVNTIFPLRLEDQRTKFFGVNMFQR